MMKRRELVPCCDHPVTAVIIDNSEKFLFSAALELDNKMFTFVLSRRPELMLKTLNNYKLETFLGQTVEHLLHGDTGKARTQLDLSQVYQDIYRLLRFSQRALVLVDYDMPGLNGLEFCSQLKSLFAHVILVSGILPKEKAFEWQNKGLFDQFVPKQGGDFIERLDEAMARGRQSYFRRLTEAAYGILSPAAKSELLVLASFSAFLHKQMDVHKLCEYFTCNAHAHLMLNAAGQPFGLHVYTEEQLDKVLKLPQARSVPASLAEELSTHRKMLCVFDPENPTWVPPGTEWPRHAHPALHLTLEGRLYRYALAKGSILVDEDRIAPFSKYEDSPEARE
ncbi:MAG: response regulator [Myxococcota bacterium]